MSKKPTLIDGRYRLWEHIGSGSYGSVHRATDLVYNKDVVVKIAHAKTIPSALRHEFVVLTQLANVKGVPQVFWFGEEAGLRMLVLSLLGPSLEEVFRACKYTFSLHTIASVAEQLIDRLQDVHDRNYVHRDLKPSNILFGHEPGALVVYLIDFSNAAEYRHPKTRLHHSLRNNQSFVGTPSFASLNSHHGLEQGRRDDLESLAYTLIYLFHGSLPWAVGPSTITEQKAKVLDLLPSTPDEIKTLLCYAKNLDYSSKPDYDYLRELMRALRAREQDVEPEPDWMVARDRLVKRAKNSRQSHRHLQQKENVSPALSPSPRIAAATSSPVPLRRSARIRLQQTGRPTPS